MTREQFQQKLEEVAKKGVALGIRLGEALHNIHPSKALTSDKIQEESVAAEGILRRETVRFINTDGFRNGSSDQI